LAWLLAKKPQFEDQNKRLWLQKLCSTFLEVILSPVRFFSEPKQVLLPQHLMILLLLATKDDGTTIFSGWLPLIFTFIDLLDASVLSEMQNTCKQKIRLTFNENEL